MTGSGSADVVIVGGGVIGSSIAFFLARDPDFDGRVLVVERDPTYEAGSTGRSAGGIRQQFSTPLNIAMSRFGIEFVRNVDDWLAVDGEGPALSFHERGYLFLATAAGLPVLEANHAIQTAHGAKVALLDPAGLAARFPWLTTEGLAAGAFGLEDEGWLDPYGLLQGFRRKARSLGVDYVDDAVTGLGMAGGRVVSARLARGGDVACGAVVNAAGIRASEIAAMAGLEIPVEARKRCVFVFECRTPLADFPLLINPNGVWTRPEGDGYICGVSPPADEDPPCDDLEIDWRWFGELVWPTIAERVPAFEAIRQTRAWAGHYSYNTLDQNAILGAHPAVANLYFANGFSGHGLQQSPAVGRGIAGLIVHGEYRDLDLSPFSWQRIIRGEPLRETNIV